MLSRSGGCQLRGHSPGNVTCMASGGDTDPKHQIPNAIALETRSWALGFPAHTGVHSLPWDGLKAQPWDHPLELPIAHVNPCTWPEGPSLPPAQRHPCTHQLPQQLPVAIYSPAQEF